MRRSSWTSRRWLRRLPGVVLGALGLASVGYAAWLRTSGVVAEPEAPVAPVPRVPLLGGPPLAAARPGDAAPDVVVLLVNALRADAAAPSADPVAGLGRPIARSFAWAYTQSVHAYLSVGSLLTGRYPSAIPLCSVPLGVAPGQEPWCSALPADVPTLPSVLAAYGYATALFMGEQQDGNEALARFGAAFATAHVDAWPSAERAVAWWTEHAGSPRLLLWLDTVDHELYAPGADTKEALAARYTAAATAHAATAGDLLDRLDDVAPTRPLRVVFTSAHGCSLLERTGAPTLPDVPVHHDVLLERTQHVPLALLARDAEGRWTEGGSEEGIVELVDVLPTLTALAGAVAPAGIPGHSFLELDAGGDAYAEFGDMLSLRAGRSFLVGRAFKHGGTSLDPALTATLEASGRPDGTFSLYDVVADPLGAEELGRLDVARLRAMRARLLQLREGPGAPAPEAVTAERVEQTRQIQVQGYW